VRHADGDRQNRAERSHTMTVYAIALLNIADRERYGAYVSGFMEIFSRHSGKLPAVDEEPTVKEATGLTPALF
jgi:uncharacterized protein (DUF1330 family)